MNPPEEDHNARVTALESAMDRHGRSILRYFVSLTKDPHLSADLSQDFWLFVFVNFPLDKFEHFGFLRRKAFHLLVDRMRHLASQKHSYQVKGLELDELTAPSVFAEPANDEEEARCRDNFWENFPSLDVTEEQKDCYWLKERYGYTLEEISGHLKVPVPTVSRWIKNTAAKMEEIWRKENQ